MNYSLKIPIGRFYYKDNTYLCMQNEKSMKKIAWILVIIAMVAGCSEARHPLLKEAADIVHQHPDSARMLISEVDTVSLSEADRTEYHLLKVMTDYIVLHQADGDSLVTTCVDYYDKHGDAWHRGRAYYYRAGIRRHLLGRTFDAIKDYKVAETIAEDADDELLKNMVYDNLAYANYNCLNPLLILEYSQKYLESSRKMNDSVMILRSLQFCASAYAYMDQSDSAYACIFRSMDYIDLADSILRADIYHNIAAMYEQKGDTENARKYLEKWKNDKSASSYKGYETMARLLEAQGHYQEAIETARKCLTEKDPLMRSHSMEMLSKLYAIIVVVFVVLIVGIWWYQRRRVHLLGFRLDENARRIAENQAEIERLQQGGEASEQTIADLKKQIEESRQRISNQLLTGTRLFVKLQQKECIAEMTPDERLCLVNYFAQLRPKRWQQWEHTYNPLTPAQYVFLILQDDLNYDDNTIAQILDVKPASLRTVKSRIKGREK